MSLIIDRKHEMVDRKEGESEGWRSIPHITVVRVMWIGRLTRGAR